ncbi:MAG TPA: hypothetical protein VE988_30760 [Gemmataceae bacterium]|nr:hypothetical protein [Gemmataceae bacterium]
MNTTVTLDIVQAVIYAGVAIGGYFVSHSGILKRLTGGGAASPTPSPQPALPGVQPALSNILKVVEDQLLEVLTDAVKRMVQPSAGSEQAKK